MNASIINIIKFAINCLIFCFIISFFKPTITINLNHSGKVEQKLYSDSCLEVKHHLPVTSWFNISHSGRISN